MEPGKIITFYSYKGGTGRTMALANAACLLAERDDCQRGVLMIDWDLEAPGLHSFFIQKAASPSERDDYNQLPGLIDMWIDFKSTLESSTQKLATQSRQQIREMFRRINIKKYIRQIDLQSVGNRKHFARVSLMKAGKFDSEYPGRVSRFSWEELFRISPWIYTAFAEELAELYDYILIDSRTGITDTSGICTMIMPEKLVVVFTPNTQSLTGVPELVRRAVNYRQSSDDLRPLVVYPIPSRIENTEPVQKDAWRFGNKVDSIEGYQNQFEKLFTDVYGLDKIHLELYFNNVQIQHIPTYSYGEKIAVLFENREDRQSLSYSYSLFVNWLIDVDSPWNVTSASEENTATILGSGAIAQGGEAVAVGDGAITISGEVRGDVILNNVYNITERTKSRTRYLQRLRSYCKGLSLTALGGEDIEQNFDIDSVYIDLDVTKQQEKINSRKTLTALDAAMSTKRMVLLGEPGSGKSTIVRHLIALQSELLNIETNPSDGLDIDLLPILINLRDLTPSLDQITLEKLPREKQQEALLNIVRTQIVSQLTYFGATEFSGTLIDALESGKVYLVLDGLDEVTPSLRVFIKQAVLALIRQYDVARIIVTCRTRAYVGDVQIPGFDIFIISPLNEEKIYQFANSWYSFQSQSGQLTHSMADDKSKDLANAANSTYLRELSKNPLLLTSMAIIHQNEVGLPTERVRLLRLFVDTLLLRWQKSKTGTGPLSDLIKDNLQLNAVVERLAYEAQQNIIKQNGNANLPRRDLLDLLEQQEYLGDITAASEFLDYVDQRAGILIGTGGEVGKPTSYQFTHRSIQEYLAGCYLAHQRERVRTFFDLASEGDSWDLPAQLAFEELFYNRRLTNELLDLAYQIGAIQLGEVQNDRAILWAGQIIALVGVEAVARDNHPGGGNLFLEKLRSGVLDLLQSQLLTPIERVEAGRVLAKLGDPRSDIISTQRITLCHIPAGKFFFGENKEPILLSDFWISKYPITNSQFDEFISDGGYTQKEYWDEKTWQKIQTGNILTASTTLNNYPNHPVVNISITEAFAFCAWFTKILVANKMKSLPFNENYVASLPSEVEWEKAAKGLEVRKYPWGDSFSSNMANCLETGINSISPVGCFPLGCSPYGCQDMSGNIWEWTKTSKNNYSFEDLLKADENELIVVRGGSFLSAANDIRCSNRRFLESSLKSLEIGFRIVVSSIMES